MKRFLIALAASALLTMPANAKTTPVLHIGNHGPNVTKLQRLLSGRDGYVFHAVKPTFTHPSNGLFGARTAAAVTAMKWRLGYPTKLVRPIAGPYLFALLDGTATRPARWVAIAASRLSAIEAAKPTALALKIKAYELDELGIAESPAGSNRGPCISYACVWHGHSKPAIQGSTGQYGAAWCVSAQQDAFAHAGYGHFADDTANVYAAADYFAARNQLHAKPKVGALVLFVDYDRFGRRIPGTGHMGYVVKVTASGYASTEGNASNRYLERFHGFHDRGNVFAYLRGVA